MNDFQNTFSEPLVGEVVAAAQLPKHGAAMDGGGVEVAAQGPDRAAVGPLGVGDRDPRAFLLLISLRAGDHHQQAAGGVEGEMFDVECDELGAPQSGGEPDQQNRPVPEAGERGCVDRLEQARERLEL